MTSRWLARAVLAAGALASIATSAPAPQWTLSTQATLPPSVLDQATVTYPLQIELGGHESFVGLEGWMTATVRVAPRGLPDVPTEVTIRLRSLSDGPDSSYEESVSIESDAIRDVVLVARAWSQCQERSCIEDFQLEIVPGEGSTMTYDIGGTIEIDASGLDPLPVDEGDLVLRVGIQR